MTQHAPGPEIINIMFQAGPPEGFFLLSTAYTPPLGVQNVMLSISPVLTLLGQEIVSLYHLCLLRPSGLSVKLSRW